MEGEDNPAFLGPEHEASMTKHTVLFLPYNLSVEIEPGTTVAEAAHTLDLYINNLCGGEGVCGQCKVQVVKGRVEADPANKGFFTDHELAQRYVLACQTAIHDDLVIFIPPESRLEEDQIMTEGKVAGGEEADAIPLVRKIYLELQEPTIEDNTSDVGRISRELRRKLGWHSYEISLGCLQHLSETLRTSEWKVTVTLAKDRNGYRILRIDPKDTTHSNYGVAVDVGTTTVVAQLIDIMSRKVLGVEAGYNQQASYGADVISRMVYACGKGGLAPLHEAVVRNINELVRKLAEQNHVPLEEINVLVAAGNTTMSHFLLGLTPCSIRLDPYVPTAAVYPQIPAAEIGIRIHPSGILETLPSVASYVGGDIVAGVMACGMTEHPEVKVLIDIGTNGEIAIGNNEWLVCCSASAGPAFEGGGTRCGMRAAKGAIEKVRVQDGHLTYQTIGHVRPKGICGTGLIDCIYELVKNRIIGQDGKFDRALKDPRLGFTDGIPEYTVAPAEESETGAPIVISESDIDNLIKSKGAVFAAIKSLVDYIGIPFEQIHTFYVAGGFGNFLNIPKAIAIGLLPDIPQEKIQFIGNSSLSGARMCLLSEEAFDKCMNVSRSMTNIELSNYKPFMDEYIAALFLPHTEQRLFPSVTY